MFEFSGNYTTFIKICFNNYLGYKLSVNTSLKFLKYGTSRFRSPELIKLRKTHLFKNFFKFKKIALKNYKYGFNFPTSKDTLNKNTLNYSKSTKLKLRNIINSKIFYLSNKFSIINKSSSKNFKVILSRLASVTTTFRKNIIYTSPTLLHNIKHLLQYTPTNSQVYNVKVESFIGRSSSRAYINKLLFKLGTSLIHNYPSYLVVDLLKNPILSSLFLFKTKSINYPSQAIISNLYKIYVNNNNLVPSNYFNFILTKKLYTSTSKTKININILPIYYTSIIRFMESISGNQTLVQFNPFVSQSINQNFIVKYKLWLSRLTFYEKRLGHKFFLEESIHIIHLSFALRDPSLLLN
jgi:hypothetical protein